MLINHRSNHPIKPGGFHPKSPQPDAPARHSTVLVVDDDKTVCRLLQIFLQRRGYRVLIAHNGLEALAVIAARRVDLVLLDVLMPEMDGFTACRELRKRTDVPIILLTALSRPEDVVHGFELGADDYITKPFALREVEVRLQAILRRVNWHWERTAQHKVMDAHDIVINDELHEVTVRGRLVHLTPTEHHLLRALMDSPDTPVSKEDLIQSAWGYAIQDGVNLVEVAMRRLREKVEQDPSNPVYLLTVRSVGYKFSTTGVPSAPPDRQKVKAATQP